MKKSMLFIPVLLLSGLVLSFRLSDSVTLKLNLKEGATYEYNTTMKQKISTSVAGQSYESNIDMTSSIDMKVEKKYGDDSMLLQTKYTHMAINTSAMGQTTSFDSNDSSSETGSELGKVFKIMAVNPVTITTDAFGKIIRINGMDQLSKAVDASLQGENPARKKMMEGLFSEQTYKHAFTNLDMFENQAVNVGDKWNQDINMTSFVPMNINFTYVVKEINPSNVVLDITGDIKSSSDSATINGMTVPIHIVGTQSGTYTVDRGTGLISTGNTDQDIHTKMSMMGQDMDVETKGNTSITERQK
ncbi:MAG: DUF6263 family protein [Chitinophagaceae bacterium]